MSDVLDVTLKAMVVGLMIAMCWNIGRISSNLERLADNGVTVMDVRRGYD